MQKNEMFDLQLFADGGAASAAGGADGADAGVQTIGEQGIELDAKESALG